MTVYKIIIAVSLSILGGVALASDQKLSSCVEESIHTGKNPFTICTGKPVSDLSDSEIDRMTDVIFSVVVKDPTLESGINQVINAWMM